VTFTEVYGLIMDTCNGCHGPGAGGLTTNSQANAYTNLVNVTSSQCASFKRVLPSNPEMSVLYLAINRSSSGSCTPAAMPRPPTAAKWEQAKIDKVKAWITAGAQND
jgi:hypothetical protein